MEWKAIYQTTQASSWSNGLGRTGRCSSVFVCACSACACVCLQCMRLCVPAAHALVCACSACACVCLQRMRLCVPAAHALVCACSACTCVCLQRMRLCVPAAQALVCVERQRLAESTGQAARCPGSPLLQGAVSAFCTTCCARPILLGPAMHGLLVNGCTEVLGPVGECVRAWCDLRATPPL